MRVKDLLKVFPNHEIVIVDAYDDYMETIVTNTDTKETKYDYCNVIYARSAGERLIKVVIY